MPDIDIDDAQGCSGVVVEEVVIWGAKALALLTNSGVKLARRSRNCLIPPSYRRRPGAEVVAPLRRSR